MLMMKCPQCKQLIKSVLLAELKTIDCEHCQAQVPVKDVLVSSNGFTFERNDLLKRFFRYRKLLDEALEERNALKSNSATSDASFRSIEKFLTILQGMMAGARDHFRYQFPEPVVARLHYSQQECSGTIYNLSMDGVCVELATTNSLPRVKGEMSISFKLPGLQAPVRVAGEICWAQQGKVEEKRGHNAGIRFTRIDDATRNTLWEFILANSRALLSENEC